MVRRQRCKHQPLPYSLRRPMSVSARPCIVALIQHLADGIGEFMDTEKLMAILEGRT